MKDFYYISHRFNKDKISILETFLKENDLMSVANFQKEGILEGICAIRLPIDDKRINVYKSFIEQCEGDPFIRLDREFSTQELNNSEYFKLRIVTAGLENQVHNQKYDYTHACQNCGAGVIPAHPLRLPLNRMGKKLLDSTAHNEWLIFRKEIAEKIMQENFTGISFHPVIIGRNENDYLWGRIDNVLPPLNTLSKLIFNDSPCELCHRSGNFENLKIETTFCYDNGAKYNFMDFNLTYEFFGEWKYSKLGGAQFKIISQKVRQFFIKEKVKRIDYIPIEFIR